MLYQKLYIAFLSWFNIEYKPLDQKCTKNHFVYVFEFHCIVYFFIWYTKKCIHHRFILLTCELLLKFTLVPNIKNNWIWKCLGGDDKEWWRFLSLFLNSKCIFFHVDTITNLGFHFKACTLSPFRYLPILLNQWFYIVFIITKICSGISLSLLSRGKKSVVMKKKVMPLIWEL